MRVPRGVMASSRSRRGILAASNTPRANTNSLYIKVGLFLIAVGTFTLYRHIERTYSGGSGSNSQVRDSKDGTRRNVALPNEREIKPHLQYHLIDDLSDAIEDMEGKDITRSHIGDQADGKKRICIVTAGLSGLTPPGVLASTMYALASYLASTKENSVYMLFVSERTPDRNALLELKEEMGVDYLEHLSGLHSFNIAEVDGTDAMKQSFYVWKRIEELENSDGTSFHQVLFHDLKGLGYYASLGKRSGMALLNTQIVLILVASTELTEYSLEISPTLPSLGRRHMERETLKYCDYAIVLSRTYFHFLTQKMYINATRLEMLHLPPPLLSRQKIVDFGVELNAMPDEALEMEGTDTVTIVPLLLYVGMLDASSGVSQFMSAVQLLEDNLSDRIVPGDNYRQMKRISRYDIAIFGSTGYHRKYGISFWSESASKFCSHINIANKHSDEIENKEWKSDTEQGSLDKPILRRCIQNTTLYIDPADIFLSLDEISFFDTHSQPLILIATPSGQGGVIAAQRLLRLAVYRGFPVITTVGVFCDSVTAQNLPTWCDDVFHNKPQVIELDGRSVGYNSRNPVLDRNKYVVGGQSLPSIIPYSNPRLIAETIEFCSVDPQACTLPISMFSSEEAIRNGWMTGINNASKSSKIAVINKIMNGLKDAVKEELVSVCVPHGGRTEFLYDSLYSLLAQSMRANEIIISLCQSSDTMELENMLTKLRKTFSSQRAPLIRKIVINEEDALTCHADELRNVAARAASRTSKWILFFDDDDIAHPHLIASYLSTAFGLGYSTSSAIKKESYAQKYLRSGTKVARPIHRASNLGDHQHSPIPETYVVDNRNVDVVVGCYLKVPADQLHGGTETAFKSHSGTVVLGLGNALAVNLIRNYYGGAAMLFRKSAFEELGGNDVIYNWIKTPFVDWALLLKASLTGIRVECCQQNHPGEFIPRCQGLIYCTKFPTHYVKFWSKMNVPRDFSDTKISPDIVYSYRAGSPGSISKFQRAFSDTFRSDNSAFHGLEWLGLQERLKAAVGFQLPIALQDYFLFSIMQTVD